MSNATFIITRTFDAPLDLVWQAHSQAEKLTKWWGPKGFDLHVEKLEFTPGGMFLYQMKNKSGFEMWGRFIYRDIQPQSKIVSVNSFADKDGNVTRNPWSPTWPLETLTTASFSESNGQTTLHLTSDPLTDATDELATFKEGHSSMVQGFGGTFDQLDAFIAAHQQHSKSA